MPKQRAQIGIASPNSISERSGIPWQKSLKRSLHCGDAPSAMANVQSSEPAAIAPAIAPSTPATIQVSRFTGWLAGTPAHTRTS